MLNVNVLLAARTGVIFAEARSDVARTLVILHIMCMGKGWGEGLWQGRGAEGGWGDEVPISRLVA